MPSPRRPFPTCRCFPTPSVRSPFPPSIRTNRRRPPATTASKCESTSAWPRSSSAKPRSKSRRASVAGKLAAGVVVLGLLASAPAAAQQGSVQLSSETQIVASDPSRRTGEPGFQPDFGINWLEPQSRFGQFQMEVHGTGNGDSVRLGRTLIAVRDLKSRGFMWTFEAGDTYTMPGSDYQFSNLSAPAITFSGGSLSATSARTTVQGSRRPIDGLAQRLRHRPRTASARRWDSRESATRPPIACSSTVGRPTCARGTSTSSSARSMPRIREGFGAPLHRHSDAAVRRRRIVRALSRDRRDRHSSPTTRTWRARTCCCRADGFRSTRHASPLVTCPC